MELVNDFTPDQFAEMVTKFKKYDADESGNIDLQEIKDMLEDLDMAHASEKAIELLQELDTDGSGELDFDEFCDFFSRLTRGDTALRGFNAIAASLNETPMTSVPPFPRHGRRRHAAAFTCARPVFWEPKGARAAPCSWPNLSRSLCPSLACPGVDATAAPA